MQTLNNNKTLNKLLDEISNDILKETQSFRTKKTIQKINYPMFPGLQVKLENDTYDVETITCANSPDYNQKLYSTAKEQLDSYLPGAVKWTNGASRHSLEGYSLGVSRIWPESSIKLSGIEYDLNVDLEFRNLMSHSTNEIKDDLGCILLTEAMVAAYAACVNEKNMSEEKFATKLLENSELKNLPDSQDSAEKLFEDAKNHYNFRKNRIECRSWINKAIEYDIKSREGKIDNQEIREKALIEFLKSNTVITKGLNDYEDLRCKELSEYTYTYDPQGQAAEDRINLLKRLATNIVQGNGHGVISNENIDDFIQQIIRRPSINQTQMLKFNNNSYLNNIDMEQFNLKIKDNHMINNLQTQVDNEKSYSEFLQNAKDDAFNSTMLQNIVITYNSSSARQDKYNSSSARQDKFLDIGHINLKGVENSALIELFKCIQSSYSDSGIINDNGGKLANMSGYKLFLQKQRTNAGKQLKAVNAEQPQDIFEDIDQEFGEQLNAGNAEKYEDIFEDIDLELGKQPKDIDQEFGKQPKDSGRMTLAKLLENFIAQLQATLQKIKGSELQENEQEIDNKTGFFKLLKIISECIQKLRKSNEKDKYTSKLEQEKSMKSNNNRGIS